MVIGWQTKIMKGASVFFHALLKVYRKNEDVAMKFFISLLQN